MDTNTTNESNTFEHAHENALYAQDRAFKKMTELFRFERYGEVFRAIKRVVDAHHELFDKEFDQVYEHFDAVFNSADQSISGADFYKFRDKLIPQFWDRLYIVENRPAVVFENEN